MTASISWEYVCSNPSDKTDFDFEILRRYGDKWAVLAAMTADMTKRRIEVPPAVFGASNRARQDRIGLLFALQVS